MIILKEKNPDLTRLSSACILCHEYSQDTIQRTGPNYGRGENAGGGLELCYSILFSSRNLLF